jgi:NAD(P)-dependent dehydrogenase (short-subunit alcohol dehydrogenase family)
MRLEGKVALVTGGSRSIGRAVALAFAREGADVAVNYARDAAAAAEVVNEIKALGRRGLAVQADVANGTQVQAMVQQVVSELGRIDILFNNAGMINRGSFLDLTEEQWDRVHSVDLRGVFLVGQAVARQMVAQGTGGAIVNTASIASHIAQSLHAHYCAAKGGVRQLTRGMAIELAPFGIRVNAVEPGVILTDMNRARFENPTERAAREEKVPMKRLGKPEDIAGAVVYLASDEAAFTTGTGILVDGGETAW